MYAATPGFSASNRMSGAGVLLNVWKRERSAYAAG